MRLLTTVIFCCFVQLGYGQGVLTLEGDSTDTALIKRKQKLEAKGFLVKIKPKSGQKNSLVAMVDPVFLKRHRGKQLPDFQLTDINGNTVSSKNLLGKYVHINFWSVTCAPCIAEFPELNELKEKFQDKDWVFLAFAPEDQQKVQTILSKHPLNYTVIPGAKQYYDLLGIDGYPKNFFVDKTGTITQITNGTIFKKTLTGKMVPDNYRFYKQIMDDLK